MIASSIICQDRDASNQRAGDSTAAVAAQSCGSRTRVYERFVQPPRWTGRAPVREAERLKLERKRAEAMARLSQGAVVAANTP
jgi:hypothetical protein